MNNESLHILPERRERLRRSLSDEGLGGYLVLHPANRFYLSGFELHDPQCNESAGCLLISRSGEEWLCTDPRYEEAARSLWPEDRLFIYRSNRNEELAAFLSKLNLQPVGFESNVISYELHAALSAASELTPSKGLVEDLRKQKDEQEIELLRRSCALNHEVMAAIEADPRIGETERDLAWALEKMFREQGASELSFTPIVASGPSGARPHHIPGKAPIARDASLLVDMGARLNDYCSDQTRSFWIGESPPSYFQETLDLVQSAQQLAIEAIRPGLELQELYHKVKGYFARFGVEASFTHALGHGIGLETHELPGLGPKSQGVLEAGMVITIEPGLYFPEWGGVRWEHMVLVSEDGGHVL